MYKEEQILEFHKIKEIWAEYALTETAKQRIDQMHPLLSEAELSAKLRETSEAVGMIEKCGNPPIAALNGILDIVEIANKGECLSATQLTEVESALVAVKRFKDYLR